MAPTQRPFFSTFFSAFRARTTTNPSFQAKSAPTVGSPTTNTTNASSTTTAAASQPRTITTKASDIQGHQHTVTSPTRSTAVPFSPSTTRYAPPLSRSPGTASPGPNPNLSMSPPGGASTPMTRGRQRRGSDSSNSSGGFMDAIGPEKWYVGGRNANGDETFYKLGMVNAGHGKRVRSLDRLSL